MTNSSVTRHRLRHHRSLSPHRISVRLAHVELSISFPDIRWRRAIMKICRASVVRFKMVIIDVKLFSISSAMRLLSRSQCREFHRRCRMELFTASMTRWMEKSIAAVDSIRQRSRIFLRCWRTLTTSPEGSWARRMWLHDCRAKFYFSIQYNIFLCELCVTFLHMRDSWKQHTTNK